MSSNKDKSAVTIHVKDWNEFKAVLADRSLRLQAEQTEKFYNCTAKDGESKIWLCRIWKKTYTDNNTVVGVNKSDHDAWEADLVAYYLPLARDFSAEAFMASDGIPQTRQSSRPRRTFITFTGRGDNPLNPFDVGGGDTYFQIVHEVGQPDQHLDVHFNCANNRTYIHEGYVLWEGCTFDSLSCHCMASKCTTQPGSGTNFSLLNYPGHPWHQRLILPAAGNGNLDLVTVVPVHMPKGMETGERPPAYWNATWTGMEYADLTPAPNGDGLYNLFAEEVRLQTFVNDVLFNGTNAVPWMLQTSESEELGQGMFLRLVPKTRGADHAWKAAVTLVLHRQRNCSTG